MKALFLIAGTAALAIAAPAAARPGNGHGPGGGHGNAYAHAYGFGSDHGRGVSYGYGRGGCPPGLRNKGCIPPGQARKLSRGERFRSDYGTRYTYGRIPLSLRRQYDLSARDRYYYSDGNLYAVDPRTMVVQQVISALLR